nr:hypothetical protein Iba_chr13aCG8510 [Ipomoea batatas]
MGKVEKRGRKMTEEREDGLVTKKSKRDDDPSDPGTAMVLEASESADVSVVAETQPKALPPADPLAANMQIEGEGEVPLTAVANGHCVESSPVAPGAVHPRSYVDSVWVGDLIQPRFC